LAYARLNDESEVPVSILFHADVVPTTLRCARSGSSEVHSSGRI